MVKLPEHGKINCTECYEGVPVEFDKTKRTEGGWRITANPLAWGNTSAEVVVLGFSKGPTQSGAFEKSIHEEIAYKGGRLSVGKILRHIGLLKAIDNADLTKLVNKEIANKTGRFHFGSLIRCTVEQYNDKNRCWKGSGGDMLGKFVKTNFGKEVVSNCSKKFLATLPDSVKLVVMLGMGQKLNYVKSSFEAYQQSRGGKWKWLNDVAYTDGKIVVVHVEHFKSQGALIPQWLGEKDHPRSNYGLQAKSAVSVALSN